MDTVEIDIKVDRSTVYFINALTTHGTAYLQGELDEFCKWHGPRSGPGAYDISKNQWLLSLRASASMLELILTSAIHVIATARESDLYALDLGFKHDQQLVEHIKDVLKHL